MTLPRLYSLKELAAALGDEVSIKLLRNEVYAGRLKVIRLSDSPNAKIFVSDADVAEYLQVHGRRRQFA